MTLKHNGHPSQPIALAGNVDELISRAENNNFKFLRLLAAVLVVFGHSFGVIQKDLDPVFRISNGAFTSSFLGLAIFFFLSGLLVSQSVEQSSSVKNFAWRRILRIYPAAVTSILLCAFVLGPLVSSLPLKDYFKDSGFFSFLSSCILIRIHYFLPGVFDHSPLGAPVNVSLWTISLELKLYTGLLLFSLLPIKRKHLLLFLASIVLLIFGYYFPGKLSSFLGRLFPGPVSLQAYTVLTPFFLLGMLVFHLRKKIFIRMNWLPLLSIFLVLLCVVKELRILEIIVFPGFILLAAAFGTTWIKRITPKPDLSYGVYVFAFPVQQIIANYLFPHSNYTFFLLGMIAVIPLAGASWYLVEKPALGLKYRVK
jgi:peptidoglycan/LPS O-acetylase OafA/YrhL